MQINIISVCFHQVLVNFYRVINNTAFTKSIMKTERLKNYYYCIASAIPALTLYEIFTRHQTNGYIINIGNVA